MDKVRLLISDQNQLVRQGIARILASDKITIAGEVRSLVEVLEVLRRGDVKIDLVLADPSVDSEQEFEAMAQIRQEHPNVRIVVLTSQTGIPWLDRALEGGASGFLPKDMSAEALRFSLELVLLGEHIFPAVRSMLEPDPARKPSYEAHAPARASESIPRRGRESQILQCLVDGLPNKTIARNLDMAEATVKVHLKSILRKLNVQNRTQAAIWGMNNPAQLRDDAGVTGETTAFQEKVKHG